jgi:EAL domain-containing protein (putative c-di-GMP-specific phosphodiesterase class I)
MPSPLFAALTDPKKSRAVYDGLYATMVVGVAIALMLFLIGSTDLMTSLSIIGLMLVLSLVGGTFRFLSMARADTDLRDAYGKMDLDYKSLHHRVNDHDLMLLQLAGQLENLETDVTTIKKTQAVNTHQQTLFMRTMKDKIMMLIQALAKAREAARNTDAPTKAKPRRPAPKNFFSPPALTANDGAQPYPARANPVMNADAPVADDDIHVSPALIQDALETALKQQRIDTYVQPIATLPQRRPFGYAVTGRVRLQPGVYIAARHYRGVAVHRGLQVALDRMVIATLPPLMNLLQTERFFINIAIEGLRDRETVALITQLIARHPALKHRLVLELSQRDFNRLETATEAVVQELQKIGVQFGVNDVSAQEMDLNKLAALNFAFLKLPYDKVVTTRLSDAGAAILHRFITRLQTRNIQLIVGQVEGADDVRPLLDFPIGLAQGYALGRPDRPITYQAKPRVA